MADEVNTSDVPGQPPADRPPTSLSRANRVRDALAAYDREGDQSIGQSMIDMLTDMRHLAAIEKIDLDWLIYFSDDCFIDELAEEKAETS